MGGGGGGGGSFEQYHMGEGVGGKFFPLATLAILISLGPVHKQAGSFVSLLSQTLVQEYSWGSPWGIPWVKYIALSILGIVNII